MSTTQFSTSSSDRHRLLRGSRWHLARPESRALWTAAADRELAELFQDARLRQRLEEMLQTAASAIHDVDTLLVFDEGCVNLACSVTLTPAAERPVLWTWVPVSLDGSG